MNTLTEAERNEIALALDDYAEGVQEVLADDDWTGDGVPAPTYPVVEDYMSDAERIRMGEQPLHELTWEVLRDPTGPAAVADDPDAFRALVERLLAK